MQIKQQNSMAILALHCQGISVTLISITNHKFTHKKTVFLTDNENFLYQSGTERVSQEARPLELRHITIRRCDLVRPMDTLPFSVCCVAGNLPQF
jgi:hypothetical protein